MARLNMTGRREHGLGGGRLRIRGLKGGKLGGAVVGMEELWE